ncbi:WH2 domain-containing protein [Candidatus Wolbachia massiliensis]|uniref:WH2 domain-containing protein n=1 Tax=Candidatus Wolbachia massiliensis TaxID=1845000 RepID=A0A7M3U2W6_9RICK|nr:WH2 domain-containing protein [Candidatus Wolbachia massiliensis]QOD38751.1 hypothetical protein ID128_02855 [Candidatus Wolbachia massiliensis]
MSTQNIQQKHIYNKRIQEFFPLFDKIKKEDDLIYNARVSFNTVKFLTEHADWDWEKDKDKACEVILQECDKTKETKQKLENEIQKRLKDYIEGGVKEDCVKIYGNHASITLEDNKKEFKISEFLNSDFCEKNKISGFSTLHSDGKSGMHGFVHNKIRHYVVTDGLYEMTLNWYVNGEKCTIKIKIDSEGVEFIEGNIDKNSKELLKANKDVKIGGLFLHEIQFREKGQEKEVQHGKEEQDISSFEAATKIDVKGKEDHHLHFRSPNSRRQSYDSGIEKDFDNKINSQEAKEKRERRQAAQKEDSEGQVYNLQSLFEENSQNKRTPPPPPLRTSSLKKDVFNKQVGLDHQDDGQVDTQESSIPKAQQQEKKGDLFQDIRNSNESNLRHINIDGRKASIERSKENNPLKKLMDKVPYLPYSNIHEHNSDNQGASDAEWKESEQPLSAPTSNSKSDLGYGSQGESSQNKRTPPPPPLRTSSLKKDVLDKQGGNTSVKPISQNQDDRQKDERYDNPTFASFGYTASGRKKTVAEGALQVKSAAPALLTRYGTFKKIEGTFKSKDAKESSSTGDKQPLNDVASILARRAEIEFLSGIEEDFNNEINSQEAKEKRERRQAAQEENSGDQVYNLKSLFEENSQNKKTPPPLPPKKDVIDEQGSGSQKPNDLHGNEQTLDNQQQPKTQQQEGNGKSALLQDIRNFKKNNLRHIDVGDKKTDVDKAADSTVSVSVPNSRNDLGVKSTPPSILPDDSGRPISPVSTDGNMDVEQNSGIPPQKSSRRSGQEPEEEEGNFQKTSEALESWKAKWPKKYEINKNVKETSLNAQEEAQSNHTNDPTPLEELKQRLNQKNYGLKQVNPKAHYVSPQTRKHLIEAGLLKDNSTDVKTATEQENNDTNPTTDENSKLHKLLEQDKAQLKVGVIEEEREDTLVERTNSHDRNRIALGNKNRLLWTKHVKQQQEKERDKGVSI